MQMTSVKSVFLVAAMLLAVPQLDAALPASVQESIKEQLQAFGIKEDPKGVPLLDTSTNWSVLANWPDKLEYRGATYALTLRGEGGDYSWSIPSRPLVDTNRSFSAHLELTMRNTNEVTRPDSRPDGTILLFSSYWHSGLATEVAITGSKGGMYRTIFILQFYRTRELFGYSRNVLGQRPDRNDYFDKKGNLAGYLIYPNDKTTTNSYVWKGKSLSDKEFRSERDKLQKGGF